MHSKNVNNKAIKYVWVAIPQFTTIRNTESMFHLTSNHNLI